MKRMQTLALAAAVATAFVMSTSAGLALAQPADAKAAAEQLFDQGRALMKEGKAAEACPKFEASLELDPALGTLLNLAHCYEETGRLASAWARYRELGNLAAREGQPKREQFARERATALEPRLPRLVIQVPQAARVAGLTVTRDGVTVDRALLGTAVYVDPGEHEVVATAPGYQRFSTSVTVAEAEQGSVDIPVLENAPVADTSAPGTTEGPGDGAGAAPGKGMVVQGAGRSDAGRTRRIAGLAAGGVGLAALAGGLGLGLSAISTWNGAFDDGLCDRDTLMCNPDGQDRTATARSRATLSNVFVGVGVGLAAAGVVLYLTAPKSGEGAGPDERANRLVPMAGPDSFGIAVRGGF